MSKWIRDCHEAFVNGVKGENNHLTFGEAELICIGFYIGLCVGVGWISLLALIIWIV